MDLLGRINVPTREIPVRAYIHSDGNTVYAGRQLGLFGPGEEPLGEAREHLLEALDCKTIPTELQYILAIMWGKNKDRMIDCFGFFNLPTEPEAWPGNPTVIGWGLINKTYSDRCTACGDGLIILGEEEQYRRSCDSLETFLHQVPTIRGTSKLQNF